MGPMTEAERRTHRFGGVSGSSSRPNRIRSLSSEPVLPSSISATGRSTSSIIVLHRPSVVSCDILFIFGYDLLQIYMHIIGCASVYPCSLQGPSLGDMSSKSKLASYQELGCMCVCIFLVQ
ncbi:hypothetical protein ZEAMMB73_Zm00001d034772 [Zea mays]|uniref:Uncharacterized protein n=1 Tax=Zea mays TaxID=4577 RepID=A0A1D6LAX8_MAIZE|nr:hypothetical protein ZEAMMB73_Zm00001d034772 [Zea mays]